MQKISTENTPQKFSPELGIYNFSNDFDNQLTLRQSYRVQRNRKQRTYKPHIQH